mgnify:CR=1 FL=1
MKIYKAEDLFKDTDEKLKEYMNKKIKEIGLLDTIVIKNN